MDLFMNLQANLIVRQWKGLKLKLYVKLNQKTHPILGSIMNYEELFYCAIVE